MTQQHEVITTQSPPRQIGGILRRLGPGLIIAGSIVGSGELIATTKTGAEAGFALLWLIVIGCVIKVFTQVEFGRYTINTGRTSMDGMNELPGPRLVVNWLVWYWLVMFLFSTGQLGGIVGAVGEAMSITVPITGDFKELLEDQKRWETDTQPEFEALYELFDDKLSSSRFQTRKEALEEINATVAQGKHGPRPDTSTRDNLYWATIITIITATMLVTGRYRMVQNVATVLVASFTLVTIVNLFAMQTKPDWAISLADLKSGFSFGLPAAQPHSLRAPLATALAAFGIIGVGASELVAYPYWCLEKGYARFTGPKDDSPEWAERARGWLRVLNWDAWCSMLVYTLATVAFYLLGAGVLFREGKNPDGSQLIPTLADMYQPVFGEHAGVLFLFGAVAVLYSTFFVASASNARVVADATRIFGLRSDTPHSRERFVRVFCGVFPFVSLLIYTFFKNPVMLVLASGVAQAIMLPMLGAAALFFRYRRCEQRTAPGRLWDLLLWISAVGLLIAGGWAALSKVFVELQMIGL